MSNFAGSTTGLPRTGMVYVDGILWGSRWRIDRDHRRLTYSFANDQVWDHTLHPAEKRAFQDAMRSWADVANIRLQFSGTNDPNAEIIFHSVPGNTMPFGALGLAQPPGESNTIWTPAGDFPLVEGEVLINRKAYQNNPNQELRVGSYDYYTYIHEIGHALGLAHPHDRGGTSSIYPGVTNSQDLGKYELNQFIWTIMSYVDVNSSYSPGRDTNWGFSQGPMAFDIAAIQKLYGVNTTHNTGNNTYHLPTVNGPGTYWSCIWDAGGVDKISGERATGSVTINLNNASLASNDPNAGGYASSMNGIRGGFTIAHASRNLGVIENAIAGSKDDTLIGNPVANSLFGSGGNDKLYGGYGTDRLYGGSDNDTLNGGTLTAYDTSNDKLYGQDGNDSLYGGYGRDYLNGGNDSDYLNGWYGNDVLLGKSGDDTLVGGAGKDTLLGGVGADRFTFNSYDQEIVSIADFRVEDDTITVPASGFRSGLRANAYLSDAQFVMGKTATTTSQRFIYNFINGGLFFDRDGIGSAAQVQIASLSTDLAMDHTDIFVGA